MPNSIEEAIAAIQNGDMIVITDSEDRENEGDLVMAAEHATPDAINFMASHGKGLICAPVTEEHAANLGLREMATTKDRYHTAFTVSIDAADGITTGISAFDRSLTIMKLADPSVVRTDFIQPGHVFPLIAKNGGVLTRPGHTEATIDLARLAGLFEAGVICEIMNEDGSMMRVDGVREFAETHELVWITIEDLIAYRAEHDPVEEVVEISHFEDTGHVKVPTRYSDKEFDLYCYRSKADGKEHLAMVYGDVRDQESVLVRVHSECQTGDIFHSSRCDCGDQLEEAMMKIVEEGQGVLVYLRQEGRGIGLVNKIQAYILQDEEGLDTVDANKKLGFPADLREYSVAAHILNDLDVKSIRLMTNNPKKVQGLEESGVEVVNRESIAVEPRTTNEFYLKTKKDRLGHML